MYTRCISLVRYTREKNIDPDQGSALFRNHCWCCSWPLNQTGSMVNKLSLTFINFEMYILRHYGSGPSHHPRIRQIIMTFNAQDVLMNVELPSIIFHYENMNITTCIFRQCRKRKGIDSRQRHRRFEATSAVSGSIPSPTFATIWS